jgi:hypothetical protein
MIGGIGFGHLPVKLYLYDSKFHLYLLATPY